MLAVLLFAPGLRAEGVALAQATPEQLHAAERTFDAANELYDAKRYDEAVSAFRASHDIVASPNSSLMMARSLLKLDRLGKAYAAYQTAVKEADAAAAGDAKYKPTQQAAHTELAALRKRVALLTVELRGAPPGTELQVAGHSVPVAERDKPQVVKAGSVQVVAKTPSGKQVTRSVTVQAGGTSSVDLDLSAPPPQPPEKRTPQLQPRAPVREGTDLRPYAYVAAGVGAVGLIGFGVFGALDNSKFNDLKSNCPNGHCSPSRSGEISTGQTYQTLANVGLIVGVVGVGAGVTLYLLSSHGSSEETGPTAALRLGPGSASIQGTF